MHRLLARQIRRSLGVEESGLPAALDALHALSQQSGLAPEAARLLAGMGDLLKRVDAAYEQGDRDLDLKTRSLELSSRELMQANDRLRDELASSRRAMESLRETARRLIDAHGLQYALNGADGLESLSALMDRLVREREMSQRELQDALIDLANQKFALDQHAIVSTTDAEGNITYANDRFCRLSGYSREELIGRNHSLFRSGVHPQRFFDELWETIRAGRVWHGEMCDRAKDGSTYWVNATIVPLCDKDGVPVQSISIRTDITALKRAEEELSRSEARYRTLVESLNEVVFRCDPSGNWTFLNSAWREITGFAVGESLGRPAAGFVHADDVERAREAFGVLTRGGPETFQEEFRFVAADGSFRWMEVVARAERDADGNPIGTAGTLSDVTVRHEIMGQLRDQLHIQRELIEVIPIPIYLKDTAGRYVQLNKAFAEFHGIERDAWLGKTVFDLMVREEAEIHAARDQQLLEHPGRQTYEMRVTAHSGVVRDTILGKATLTRADGSVAGLVGTLVDVTESRRAAEDLRRARDAAEAANRAKSGFLATMSHEIRTPMNGIIGMTDLVLDSELDDEQRGYLQIVKSSADSLLSVLNDILDFSKIEAGKLLIETIPFDLWRVVGDTLHSLAQGAHNKRLELVCDIACDVPERVNGDPGRLRQILVNLVGNAIKFTERGEIVVRVACEERGGDRAVLRFSVADTGIGIPEDKINAIFEAFTQQDSSTTRRYGGTGLGLSISKRLAEALGGRIWVESRVGRGSTFHFTVALGLDTARPDSRAAMGNLCGIRILAVDDNAINRLVLARALTDAGALVVEADSGESALDRVREAGAGQPFQAILLDSRMPGLDGFATAERLRPELGEGTRLVMLSSGGVKGDGQRCRDMGFSAYLSKPVTRDELLHTLGRLFGDEGWQDAGQLLTRHVLREQTTPLNVLLAEDHEVNQKYVRDLLERWGHRVTLAKNGEEALAATASTHFDLVLMDMMMPVMDGLEATRRIRAAETQGGAARTPIVAMTANVMPGDRETCLAAGMDDYLAKPLRGPELLRVLRKFGGGSGDAEWMDGTRRVAGEVFDYAEALASADRESVEIIASTFLAHYPEDIERMRSARAGGDSQAVLFVAHALRGTLIMFGAEPAVRLAQSIEHLARRGECARMDELIAQLDAELEGLAAALRPIAEGGATK